MNNSLSKTKILTISFITLLCSFSFSIASIQGFNGNEAFSSKVPPINLPNLNKILKHSTSELKSKKMTKLESEQMITILSKEILEDSKAYINYPRVGFLSSLTSDKLNINYLNDLATHLQRTGSGNISQGILKNGIEKTVIVSMRIDSLGHLVNASINQSSNIKEIDLAALKIIEVAAPYEPLPDNISSKYDQVNIIRTFLFNGDK